MAIETTNSFTTNLSNAAESALEGEQYHLVSITTVNSSLGEESVHAGCVYRDKVRVADQEALKALMQAQAETRLKDSESTVQQIDLVTVMSRKCAKAVANATFSHGKNTGLGYRLALISDEGYTKLTALNNSTDAQHTAPPIGQVF